MSSPTKKGFPAARAHSASTTPSGASVPASFEDELRHLRLGEAAEGHVEPGREAGQHGKGVGETIGGGRVDVAVDGDEERAKRRDPTSQVAGELEGRGVGPMDVVEHHSHGPVLRQALEEALDGLEEPVPGRQRVEGRRRRHTAHRLRHLRDQLRQLGGRRGQGPAEGVRIRVIKQGTHHLDPRPERRGASALLATAPGHHASAGDGVGERFPDEPGLSDAGLPRHEHYSAGPLT